MPPSFLTMAVISAEAGSEARAQKAMGDCYDNHAFAWLNWLIILTASAILMSSLWQMLTCARRHRIDRQTAPASLGHAPTRPGHRHPAHRA